MKNVKTILAFGDSLTWGYNAGDAGRHAFEDRWPNALGAKLGAGYRDALLHHLDGAASLNATSPFSSAAPGAEMPAGWHEQRLRSVEGNRFRLVAEQGSTVLRIESSRSARVPTAGSAWPFMPSACVPAWPWSSLREKAAACSAGPSRSASARAISLRSSRMLPGQG